MSEKNKTPYLQNILLCAALGVAVSILLLFSASALILSGTAEEGSMQLFSSISCVVGCAAGSLMMGKRTGNKLILAGISYLAVYFLLLLLIKVICFSLDDLSGIFVSLLCCLIGTAAGIVICAAAGKKSLASRSQKRRKHKKFKH